MWGTSAFFGGREHITLTWRRRVRRQFYLAEKREGHINWWRRV
jgi:hypothetical protein